MDSFHLSAQATQAGTIYYSSSFTLMVPLDCGLMIRHSITPWVLVFAHPFCVRHKSVLYTSRPILCQGKTSEARNGLWGICTT
jgi:hypothetical protein